MFDSGLYEPAFFAGAAALVALFAAGIAGSLPVLETNEPAADQLTTLFHGLNVEW